MTVTQIDLAVTSTGELRLGSNGLLSTSLPLGLSEVSVSNIGRAEEFESVWDTKGVLRSALCTTKDEHVRKAVTAFISWSAATLPVVLARANNGGAEGSVEVFLPDMLGQ